MSLSYVFRAMTAGEPPSPYGGRSALQQGYVLLAVVVGLAMLLRALPAIHHALDGTPWDLNVDLLTARAYLDGYSPYTPEGEVRSGAINYGATGSGHPPTTSFWMLPLARMSSRGAAAALGWISMLALLIELAVTMSTLRYVSPLASAWLALGYLLCAPFMVHQFDVGQISTLIAFLYFAAWAAGRRREDWAAGAALGAACTMKMFPGILVLFFLVTLRWRAVASAVVVYLVVAAIMSSRFGLSSWWVFLAKQKPVADLWMPSISNQSIHGVILRLYWPACGPGGPVLRSATVISSAISLLMVAGGIWLVRPIVHRGGFDLGYALFVVLSVVTSQWSWEHYAVIYVLPALIMGAYLVRAWRAGEHRARIVAMSAGLAAVVASWQLNVGTKLNLQGQVLHGNLDHHVLMHVHEVLNWLPGFCLLAMVAAICWWERRRFVTADALVRVPVAASPQP